MISPFIGGEFKITSVYGERTLDGIKNFHYGIDCVGLSSKRICAVSSGVVAVSQIITDKSNPTWEWGNYVAVLGDDGNIVYYCHMSERIAQVGQRVNIGDQLGIEGNTGYSFGSHLHLEVRRNNIPFNAADYIGVPNQIGVYNANPEPNVGNIPNDWAKDAFDWAVKNSIILGDDNGNYDLRSFCTREQVLVFLYRLYNLINN